MPTRLIDIRLMNGINLSEGLRLIRERDYRDGKGSFSATFMLCHRHKQTGGELIELTNACCCGLPPNCNGHEMVGIKDMETGKPYPVHNRLLFVIEGKEVYWV